MDDEIYQNKVIESTSFETPIVAGRISEKDRFRAAKQILLGISILFTINIFAYLFNPKDGKELLEICKTIFPPLATLIIAFYFKDRMH